MKVHIVTLTDHHIVPRMMSWLVDEYGWTMAVTKADIKADINYYASYLSFVNTPPVDTLKAAWFTHFEETTPQKVDIWNYVQKHIDLKMSVAQMYVDSLPQSGLSHKLTAGVDRDFFTPLNIKKHKYLIGTSGMAQPRKGPELIQLLRQHNPNLQVIVTGQGWAVPHTWVKWEQMPRFYNALDVYLCTSLIEGIPMPPLEALSCGTKIVIPKNVGMLDELPEMPGIRHFTKGDFTDMIRAINLAIQDNVSKQELRAITENYTIKHWAKTHRRGFEKLLKG